MQLAKYVIDVGLSTNDLEPMPRFWQQDAGCRDRGAAPVNMRDPDPIWSRQFQDLRLTAS
jgi:hypothetical protein